MLGAVLLSALSPIVLYATDKGKDEWAGTQRSPFRTIQRLQRELLTIRANGDLRPATIKLRGQFRISEELVFGPEFNGCRIEGKAVVSGGEVLSDWKEVKVDGKALWEAHVPHDRQYRQLFIGDERRPVARLPKQGFYRLTSLTKGAESRPWNVGQDEAVADHSHMGVSNLQDVDFVAHHYWIQSRMGISNFDRSSGTVRFDRKSVFRLTDDYTGQAAPYRLYNVLDGLTEPGEWISDTKNRRILYHPKRGERLRGFRGLVAGIPTLLRVKDVRGLTLRDIEFTHSEWTPPADNAGDPQAAISTPGAVVFENSLQCVLKACRVQNVGTYGIEILGGRDNTVDGCDFFDLGGGGLKIGHGSERTRVLDCAIVGGGRIFAPAVGIWIGNSGGNLISHNLIQDLFYTGISVGWTWGYGPSNAVGNVIEFNDIRDLGQGELSDMGGIYTLGVSPGTVLHHNRIRNIEARGYGGWGIYLDEGSTNILVENNLVRDTKTGGFHQHYGKENLIRNNVFMNARTEGQLIRTRAEDHKSFTLERNVVVWKGTPLFAGNWQGSQFSLEDNVFWRTDGEATVQPFELSQSQATFADPMIRIDHRGVSFGASSSAMEKGIKPIDLTTVGPRRRLGKLIKM